MLSILNSSADAIVFIDNDNRVQVWNRGAEATNGARIDLSLAPLKYPGLMPWEVLISEAQERMTIAVSPDRLEDFMTLAKRREVEATVLGEFTDDGRFDVRHGEQSVVDLPLSFLHEGWPRARLKAAGPHKWGGWASDRR